MAIRLQLDVVFNVVFEVALTAESDTAWQGRASFSPRQK
jgi:hypothetical protein